MGSRSLNLRGVGLVLAGLVALANVMVYRHADRMMRYVDADRRTPPPEELTWWGKIAVLAGGVSLPRPESNVAPDALGPGAEAWSLTTRDGYRLGAWWLDQGEDSVVVILFHGYGMEKTSLLGPAHGLLEHGASVLLVDFRGSGESAGSMTTLGLREAMDVKAAVAEVRARFPGRRLVLFGQSMGAAAVLRGVAREEVVADGLILESVFDSLLVTAQNRFSSMGLPRGFAYWLLGWGWVIAGESPFDHEPARDAVAVQVPALLLHGAEDPRTGLDAARRVASAIGPSARLVAFEGAGHENLIRRHPEAWREAVGEFLDAVVAGHSTDDGVR
ncbi:MAG TPA: alpha/beta fold hydrolase [Kiritimatiellia bacterium]|nr:alpha/beta fold hydrolase [Kiritimatiellia bacterium]